MKYKRLFALLLVFCLMVSMMPAQAAAEGWNLPSISKMVDTDAYVNPFYDGPVVGRGPASQPESDDIPEPDVYYADVEAAAAQMREQMVGRQAQIVIGFEAESKSQTLMRDIYGAAVAHTQMPEEGDYLRWNTRSWQATRYTSYDGTCYSMIIVYEIYYYTTAEQEQEMDAAVGDLLEKLDLGTASHYEKIRGAYDWICENVVYDHEHLDDDTYTLKQSSYAALINGTSVCQGYATLLYRLLMELDVDCRVIVGDAGGGHAWNIVEMDGLYYNADSTWDATYAKAGRDYCYFMRSEADFADHVRDEEYLTEEFQTQYPMSETVYEPLVYSGLWGDNVTWVLEDGVLTISGEGAMDEDSSASAYPWHEYRDQVIQVVVKSGVTSISWSAFRDCENMEKAVIEEGVERLGRHAFSNCKKLKEIQLPSTLKVIDADCFMWTGLETIDLPDGLEELGAEAFYESSLTEIVIPDSVTTMDISVFDGCVNLKTAVLSRNCEIIPSNMFWNCTALEEVTIPEGVTTLEWCVFEGCTSLKNVVLPSTMTTLHVDCFEGCTSLTSVVIPESVTYFVKPFRNCSGLKSMIFLGDAPVPEGYTCFLDSTAFEGVTANIYYPAGNDTWTGDVMQQYSGTLTWIPYDAMGTCAENLNWILSNGVLTISGTGEMLAYPAPWEAYGEQITKVVIEAGVTNVGDSAFKGCTALETVVIPEGVTYIGPEAFYGCTSLVSVELPEGVKDICGLAFANCTSLATVTLPEGLETIWSHAFNGCTSLEEITIPASVTEIWLGAFANCSNLRKITFKGNAPFFDPEVFYGVTATAYYPAGDTTWTPEAMTHYGANITWIPVFPDVLEGEYYCEPVMWAVEQGITTGTGDGSTFSPERACSRAQVVTFLWRAAGCPEPQSMNHNFTDVEAGSYYEKAVIWAVENGITSGKGSSTTFQPETTCNRAEVVTFLWRAKGKPTPESNSNPFPDVPAGSYYEQAVLWAVENGITTGKGNGNFAPTESCTRAHVVTFLYRAFAEE